jgi:hypothetical protein
VKALWTGVRFSPGPPKEEYDMDDDLARVAMGILAVIVVGALILF